MSPRDAGPITIAFPARAAVKTRVILLPVIAKIAAHAPVMRGASGRSACDPPRQAKGHHKDNNQLHDRTYSCASSQQKNCPSPDKFRL